MGREPERPLRKLADFFETLAATVDSKPANLDLDLFCRGSALLCPLLRAFGPRFRLVEIDYANKVRDLENASKSVYSLSALIDMDIENNRVRVIRSLSGKLLRVKRSLDFVRLLFKQNLEVERITLKRAAAFAYDELFAPYHGKLVRRAVSFGLAFLPTKSQMLKRVNEDENSVKVPMGKFISSCDIVARYVEELYLSKGMGIDW